MIGGAQKKLFPIHQLSLAGWMAWVHALLYTANVMFGSFAVAQLIVYEDG